MEHSLVAPELQRVVGSVLPPPLHSTTMTLAPPMRNRLFSRDNNSNAELT
jgi:hypothetical protein